MSEKNLKRKLYIQNLTTGEIREIPYWGERNLIDSYLRRDTLFYEVDEMLCNTDNIKIFYTYD